MDYFLGRNDEQMQCRGILHIVEAGDTLYKIGKKYGVAVSQIMYANPYVNVYNLQIGDEICVPVMVPRMPMGEAGANGSMNRMPVRERPAQANTTPAFDNYLKGNTQPIYESDARRYMIPAQEPAERERIVPMAEMEQSNPAGRVSTPSDQMGFSATVRDYGDVNQQAPGNVYMGNCMTPAREMMNSSMYAGLGESAESGMQEMPEQSDRTGITQEMEENDRNEMSQRPEEAPEQPSEQADQRGISETFGEIPAENQSMQGTYPSDMNFL